MGFVDEVESKRDVEDEDEERLSPRQSVVVATVPSYHFTLLSCFSLTESKQMGHLAHLFSEVLR